MMYLGSLQAHYKITFFFKKLNILFVSNKYEQETKKKKSSNKEKNLDTC